MNKEQINYNIAKDDVKFMTATTSAPPMIAFIQQPTNGYDAFYLLT